MSAKNINRKPQNLDYIDDVPLDEFTKQNVRSVVENAFDYQEPDDEPSVFDDDDDASFTDEQLDSDMSDDDYKKSLNPNSKEFFYSGAPVYAYRDLFKANRKNVKVKGCWFDVDTFENLIDCYTPQEMIKVILRCSGADLDRFCQVVYGMKFSEAYNILSGITDMYMRKSFKVHSNLGNSTAMKIVSEHFMKLKEDEDKGNINITVYNDLKGDEEE